MLLLIDGYNLLYQSDLMERGRGEHWLQRARERLLRQLQRHLDDSLAAQTCVVFDAESPPPDRSCEYIHFGIRVVYAVGYPEADDLVEELIARHAAPQRLTVISSDHRLQRAARRRRAHAFDSDSWYHRLLETGPHLGIRWPPGAPPGHDDPPLPVPEKLEGVADAHEVEAWIKWFEQAESSSGQAARRSSKQPLTPLELPPSEPGQPPDRSQGKRKTTSQRTKPTDEPGGAKKQSRTSRRGQTGAGPARRHDERLGSPDKQLDPSMENPFPEGYGEDLLDDDE